MLRSSQFTQKATPVRKSQQPARGKGICQNSVALQICGTFAACNWASNCATSTPEATASSRHAIVPASTIYKYFTRWKRRDTENPRTKAKAPKTITSLLQISDITRNLAWSCDARASMPAGWGLLGEASLPLPRFDEAAQPDTAKYSPKYASLLWHGRFSLP